MKYLKSIFILSIATLALLASCEKSSSTSSTTQAPMVNSGEVNVYNWTVYINQEVREQFTKETGIKLNYKEYESNEEMFTTLQSGDNTWDIVFPSQDYVPVLIEKNMAVELDKSKIPNFATIDPEVLATTSVFDPGNRYSVPFNLGATGIIYWKDKVKLSDAEKSWGVLARADLKGHTSLMDDMREVLGAALRFSGSSLNTANQIEIDRAVGVVEKWKSNTLKAFDSAGVGKNFAAKNYWAVFNYPENTISELDEAVRDQVGFFLPKEGGPKYLDSFVILNTGKNQDNAYKFINFILRPDVLAQILDAYGYPGISAQANSLRKTKALYTLAELKKNELKLNLGSSLDLYTKAWQEKIKIGQ